MTDEQAINDLIDHPPVPVASSREKIAQAVRDLCIVVVIAALIVAFVQQAQARGCVSRSFEQRDNAEITRITGQVAGLEQLKQGNQKGLDTFATATENYLKYVARHPLGTCK